MLENRTKLIEIIVFFSTFLIIGNYLTLFFIFNEYLIKTFFLIFLFTIIFFIVYTKLDYLYLKIAFLALIIISLGDATEDWDAWAVWLFKAKRIFVDQSILGFLDGYASFQNNDQPLLAPSFASTVGIFLGKWNEIFPKVGILLITFPPLILSVNIFYKHLNFIFICLTIYLINTFFINGFLDGLVAIYFIFSAYLFYNIFIENKFSWLKYLILINFLIILSLLKNEGLVIILILFFYILIFDFIDKKSLLKIRLKFLSLFSLLPLIYWKYLVHISEIDNYHLSDGALTNLVSRMKDISTYQIIFEYLIGSYSLLFAILFFTITYFLIKKKILTLYVSYVGLTYLFSVILVHLLSKMDFEWGIAATLTRVISMPIAYLFTFFALYQYQINKKFINYND